MTDDKENELEHDDKEREKEHKERQKHQDKGYMPYLTSPPRRPHFIY